MREAQRNDNQLEELRTNEKEKCNFWLRKFGKTELWTLKSSSDGRFRIFVPVSLHTALVEWFHNALMHPGASRMEESVKAHFTWPRRKRDIKEYVRKCKVCQMTKSTNKKKQGKIPLKDEREIKPFKTLTVDLCGPWPIQATVEEKVETNQKSANTNRKRNSKTEIVTRTKRAQIWALTIVDEGSGWPEVIPIENKKSKEIALLVDAEWFCRYPRPLNCIHDNGTEFTGEEFQEMLESYGVKSKPTTVKNQQANAIHERVHLMIAEMLRTQELVVPHDSTVMAEVRRLLQSVAYALRATTNTVTKYSSGQLIFGRDMLIHQSDIVDWDTVRSRKRAQQIRDNERENSKRANYTWKVGDKCLIVTSVDERKGKLLKFKHKGPYDVIKVNNNGTVRIKSKNFEETINIRRLSPFNE